MTVVIRPNETISGIDPKVAQGIVRFCFDAHRGASADELASSFKVEPEMVRAWLHVLEEGGYVKEAKRGRRSLWECTQFGMVNLAAARIGKPMTYREVESGLRAIANRAVAYNGNNRFPHLITEIEVSGLEKRSDGLCQDPDIFIRFRNRGEEQFGVAQRFGYAEKFGPARNLTIIDRLAYSEREMNKILFKGLKNIKLLPDGLSEKDGYVYKRHTLFALNERDEWTSDSQKSDSSDEGQLSWTIDTRFLASYFGRANNTFREKVDFAAIVDYWNGREGKSGPRKLSICCWRCGSKENLHRCHIVPKSLGGLNTVSNYVILCSRCHAEAPNVVDRDIMWDWIRAHRVDSGLDYWLLADVDEYVQLYGYVPHEMALWIESQTLLERSMAGVPSFEACIERVLRERASVHFGQGAVNSATMAGVFRLALKEMSARLLGKDFQTLEQLYLEHDAAD